MFDSLLNAVFGCSHHRITFPLTPSRRAPNHASVPPAQRHGMYVVCLDCGKEFAYDWEDMRIGEPVTERVPARPAHTFANR